MEQSQLQAVWEQILNKMREQLAKSAFKWLDPVQPLALTSAELVLGTQTGMAKDWISSHYLTILADAVTEVLGSPRQITIKVIEEPASSAPPADLPVKDTQSPKKTKGANPNQVNLFNNSPASEDPAGNEMHIVAPGDSSSLNPKYTFDTFVTGSSNRFAHAAAMAVAESPGRVYNPFFMYGGVGLGKTHLMHAIGNRVLHNHP